VPSAKLLPAQARRCALLRTLALPPMGLRRRRCRPPPLQRLRAGSRRVRGAPAPLPAMLLGQVKLQAGNLAAPWRGAQAPRQAMRRGQLEPHLGVPPSLGEGPLRQRQRRQTGRTHGLRR